MTPRHIDQNARMVWLTLRNAGGEWSARDMVRHWRPTFTEPEVRDALERLVANGCARRCENRPFAHTYTAHGCAELPFANAPLSTPTQETCST